MNCVFVSDLLLSCDKEIIYLGLICVASLTFTTYRWHTHLIVAYVALLLEILVSE